MYLRKIYIVIGLLANMKIHQNIFDQYKIFNMKKLILSVAYSGNLMGRKWEGKNVGMKDSYPTFVFLTERSTMWRIESSKNSNMR